MGDRHSDVSLSGGHAHKIWLHDVADGAVSRGHGGWCPAYVQSEQASPSTTHYVARWQCGISYGWEPASELTSPQVGGLQS